MANNSNISSEASKQFGYNLSRTSYDIRQEINAKVIGVLKYNNEIREKLLKRNIGLYPLLDTNEGIGYISNYYSLESSKPLSLGEEGLLGYTHIHQSDYQDSINKKYNIGGNVSYYQHGSLPDKNFLKWNGKYEDYTEYIDEIIGVPANLGLNFISESLQGISDTFGTSTQMDKVEDFVNNNSDKLLFLSSLNDILQYDNIKYAMEKTRIGTITPNPIAAFSGAVTTNINNFSGTDTNLGLITNYLYAASLNNGAHFNSLRKTKYITPDAYSSIGNKLSTLSVIGSDFRIDDETGRIIADFTKNTETSNLESQALDSYTQSIGKIDTTRDIAYSKHAQYKNIIRNKERFLPFKDDQYAWENFGFNLITTPSIRITSDFATKTLRTWNEGTSKVTYEDTSTSNGFGVYEGIKPKEGINDLITKTHELFRNKSGEGRNIDTLVGRFYTEGGNDKHHNEASLFQTAVSIFGMSRGRNLLRKEAYDSGNSNDVVINGYDNPYCRAWTYHHQYDNVGNLIRPFGVEYVDDGKIHQNILGIADLQKSWYYGRSNKGPQHLGDNTVLTNEGFVNIAPRATDSTANIKNCMFSIENLAWKDIANDMKNLSPEQRGPNGGRIMWFPPYDLQFNENVSVNWNPSEFIGRGEKIYTYTNTERSGTLSFILLVDHPSILDAWNKNGKTGDDEYNEQTLLRFFAGCEVLTLDNNTVKAEYWNKSEEPVREGSPSVIANNKKSDTFYIFFPHNYSGYDDSLGDAVEYLTTRYASDGKTGVEYRTDKDTEFIKDLETDNNKKDNNRYKLNTNTVIPGLIESFDLEANFSFKQMVDEYNNYFKNSREIHSVSIYGYSSTQEYDVIQNKDSYEIKNSIKDSNKKHNTKDELSERRAIFAKKFVKKVLGIKDDLINIKLCKTIKVSQGDEREISGKSAVLARRAKIEIEYTDKREKILIEQFKDWLKTNKGYNDGYINSLSYDNLLELEKDYREEIAKQEQQKAKEERKATKEKNRKARQCNKKNPKADYCDNGEEIYNSIYNAANNSTEDSQDITPSMPISSRRGKIISGYKTEPTESQSYQRWEDEAKYFEQLKANDSFLYSRIVDKIKYFTPAFHSITPEGFNARLGFLHQCTRQGQTYSVSDTNNKFKSAGNLAFGRPPICVLRIGDFYHTKIVINSITINYENPQWDMNPEGIGMQPMFARISLNFTFLGGSDIEGPIARLQNAISFNFYANQSIYDDRADKTTYSGINAKIEGTPWAPTNVDTSNKTKN